MSDTALVTQVCDATLEQVAEWLKMTEAEARKYCQNHSDLRPRIKDGKEIYPYKACFAHANAKALEEAGTWHPKK